MLIFIETYGSYLAVTLVGFVVCGFLYLLIRSLKWAYRDAEARGKSGRGVTLLLLLCKWPISLLLWIMFRPPITN